MSKKTVGQQVAEHNSKNIQFEDDIRAYTQEMGKEQRKRLEQEALRVSNLTQFKNKDFYLQLINNVDGMLHEAKWILDIPRHACPTPCYSTSVFKYHHISAELEFLWHLPSKHKCYWILKNLKTFATNPVSARTAEFVKAAHDGSLLRWVIKENGNKPDGIIQYKDRNPYGRPNSTEPSGIIDTTGNPIQQGRADTTELCSDETKA
jgi:hypothetical protein